MRTTNVDSILQDLSLDLGRNAASVWELSDPLFFPKVGSDRVRPFSLYLIGDSLTRNHIPRRPYGAIAS